MKLTKSSVIFIVLSYLIVTLLAQTDTDSTTTDLTTTESITTDSTTTELSTTDSTTTESTTTGLTTTDSTTIESTTAEFTTTDSTTAEPTTVDATTTETSTTELTTDSTTTSSTETSNSFKCYGKSCPSGTIGCRRIAKTVNNRNNISITICCLDFNGRSLKNFTTTSVNPKKTTNTISQMFFVHHTGRTNINYNDRGISIIIKRN
ncbi:uncharacterized protein LOC109606186 isoform X2 [Aethina tumida]|uniref:uncharacterized protein LOC109606186 isoform X2 n=1 Tax=Aethina tumida TaxID=116153 RepID=UPI002148D0FF|nr:uncharacterized protein LOC109606186 isoform X2 [Aethina tumida]